MNGSLVTILRGLAVIAGFAFLVFAHEFGHFLAARLSKVKVTDFFIGFGPKLFSVKRGETTYGIAALPLGGYVKMAGDNLLDEEGSQSLKDNRSLPNASFIKKLFIVISGPAVNLLLAFLILSIAFGFEGVIKPTNTVAATVKNSPARGVLKKGDKIVAINGRKITNWDELSKEIRKHPRQKVEVVFIRNGQRESATLKTIIKQRKAMVGIYPMTKQTRFLTLSESLKASAGFIFIVSKTTAGLILKAITGQPAELAKNSSSIVGAVYLGVKISTTFLNFLFFVGYVSLVLAFVNLLPIPPLDAGRALLFIAEKIKRGPIKRSTLMAVNAVGLAFLFSLFLFLILREIFFGFPNV